VLVSASKLKTSVSAIAVDGRVITIRLKKPTVTVEVK
jgi:hypothetical protein